MSYRSSGAAVLLALCSAVAVPAQEIPQSLIEELQWHSIGPANMGGRIIDLAVYEADPSLFWVATASGGLLKTTNNGVTFEHQFDHEEVVSLGAVAVAPSDPNVVWVGTGEYSPRNSVSYGNGVYKSVDGGETWQHMGLKESFQTGDLVIHPDNPDVVYVGSLGRLYGANEERGLYKTTDGGASWERILFVDDMTGVINIAMHPEDPDTFLVATYERQRDGFDTNDPVKKIAPGSGLYRTTDGGASFTEIREGLPSGTLGRIGLDFWRKDPNVVFAIVESDKIGMAGEGVGWPGLRAEDAETGARITSVEEGGPAAAAGLAEDDIVLAVAGSTVLSRREMLEAMATHPIGTTLDLEVARAGASMMVPLTLAERPEPETGESGGGRRRNDRPFGANLGGQAANIHGLQGAQGHEHGGVYRSDDGGVSWRRINSINPRPMYFSVVRVDPADDQNLFVLGVSMARSVDGGETFTNDAGRGVHSDQHSLWIDPRDPRHMILGTDGGLYVTYDASSNWDHLSHVAIGQFYHVATGPRRDYWVYGGLQDNGSWGAPHRSASASGTINEDWVRVGGGDGFVCRVDPEDPNRIYYESQNGSIGRTHLETMESARLRPRAPEGVRYRFNWETPFLLSHHNAKIYYTAGNHVFRSLDRGEDLVPISPDITRTERGSATALAESPIDPGVMYVGTDDGALFGTRNGGHDWVNLWDLGVEPDSVGEQGGPRGRGDEESRPLAELVPGPRWVTGLEASREVEGRVYLCLDGHRSDDDEPYVLVSEDYGQTWRSLRANLPWGSTRVVREDLHNPNLLWLGTEFHLYASMDRGAHWTRLNGSDLPTVAIHEIAQHQGSGDIVLATHGRSLWRADATALRQLSAEALDESVWLLEPAEAVQWRGRARRGVTGARRFYGDNAQAVAEVYYRLEADARSARLEILDAAGELVRSLDAETGAGFHRARWDLRPTTPPAEPGRRGRFRRRPPMVEPGNYRVVLVVDGERREQGLRVSADPGERGGF